MVYNKEEEYCTNDARCKNKNRSYYSITTISHIWLIVVTSNILIFLVLADQPSESLLVRGGGSGTVADRQPAEQRHLFGGAWWLREPRSERRVCGYLVTAVLLFNLTTYTRSTSYRLLDRRTRKVAASACVNNNAKKNSVSRSVKINYFICSRLVI